MDTKRKGDIAEQSVILKAMKLGFDVLTPIGDRLPYDLVLAKGHRFFRIQVKAAWYDAAKDNYVVDVRRTKTNRRTMLRDYYQDTDFDFAILCILEVKVFYIMPVDVFNSYASEIHLVESNKRQRKPRSAQYREAWELVG